MTSNISDCDKLPASYRNQASCATCDYCFIKHEHDAAPELFCSLHAPLRPLCGSVLMDETHAPNIRDGLTLDEYDAIWGATTKLWDDWSLPRVVTQRGICDHHRPHPDSAEMRLMYHDNPGDGY